MVVVHVAPLLLLQAALVHGVQHDPVECVEELGLGRPEVVYRLLSTMIIDIILITYNVDYI